MLEHRQKLLTGLFAAAAFVQTLAYYLYLRDDPGNYNSAGATGDQVFYIELAQQVARGTWEGHVHYMPGYPAIIALGQGLFGDPRLGVAVIQALVYAGIVFGAHVLAEHAFGYGSGPWAAGFVALNPAIGATAAQALTEFLTGALLFATIATTYAWFRSQRVRYLVGTGLLGGGMAYLRSDYLLMVATLSFVVFVAGLRARLSAGRALAHALLLAGVTLALIAPWALRYYTATGRLTLYNEDPTSNLILMGTWFRVFDEQAFSRLQDIANDTSIGREEAIRRASEVGPRAGLSVRYMEQVRGPYVRPLGETLQLATENARLIGPRFLVNHLVLAPVLIWGARTPVRQADVPLIPAPGRWLMWGAQLALLAAALWQAGRALRRQETFGLGLAFLGACGFLTLVHLFIGVDERFTSPALPLIQLLAGALAASLAARWQKQSLVEPRMAGTH